MVEKCSKFPRIRLMVFVVLASFQCLLASMDAREAAAPLGDLGRVRKHLPRIRIKSMQLGMERDARAFETNMHYAPEGGSRVMAKTSTRWLLGKVMLRTSLLLSRLKE